YSLPASGRSRRHTSHGTTATHFRPCGRVRTERLPMENELASSGAFQDGTRCPDSAEPTQAAVRPPRDGHPTGTAEGLVLVRRTPIGIRREGRRRLTETHSNL